LARGRPPPAPARRRPGPSGARATPAGTGPAAAPRRRARSATRAGRSPGRAPSRGGGPLESPRGGVANDGVRIVQRSPERGPPRRVAAVAEHESRVAEEAAPPRALEGGPPEPPAEGGLVEREPRRERLERLGGAEGGIGCRRRLPVPRAHRLADVAAERPVPDAG